MSPITATTSKNSNAIYLSLYIHVIQCVCGLDIGITIQCSEAHGIRTQVVVNKTTLKSVFDTIYFNQMYTLLDMLLDLVVLKCKSFCMLTGPSCDLKHAHDVIRIKHARMFTFATAAWKLPSWY